MRKLLIVAVTSTAIAAIGCGRAKSPSSTAMNADLKRDLQLASATQNIQISPDEISPQSKNEIALRPKKAPDGPKVVRSNHPTVKASANPVDVADLKSQVPQVEVLASSPAPSESPTSDAPPLARPAPVPVQPYPSAAAIPASGQGGVGAGVWGSIIRGGAVGDDDHCDPRGAHRTGRPIGGDVIFGRPGGMGGMGSGRFPFSSMGHP